VFVVLLLQAGEEEAERVRQERVKAYEAKKANSKSLLMPILLNLMACASIL